jgi:hypothetical protein
MADIPTNPGDSKAPPASPRDLAVWTKLLDDAKPKAEPSFDNSKLRLYTNPGVCASCHPKEKDYNFKLDLTPLDFGSFPKHREIPVKAATEIKVVADTPELRANRDSEKFKRADPVDKTATVLSRLPEKLTIDFSGNKLTVQTDFAKLAEATPGVQLDPTSKDILSSIKQLSLNGDTFAMDLKDSAKLPINKEILLLGKVTDLNIGDAQKQVKFDVAFDAKNPDQVSFKNISGVSLGRDGRSSLAIHELTIDTSQEKPRLIVTIDNPLKFPKDTMSVPLPLASVVPGMDTDFLKGMVKTLSDSKAALQKKDASMLLSGLPDEGIRTKLQEMLKGLTSIDKNGDTFTVRRNNGVTEHDFGGPKLSVSPTLSFKLGKNPNSPTVTDIKGIDFSVPLPSELQLGNRYSTALTEVSLGAKYGDNRNVSVRTSGMIDSVSIRLNKDMVPQTDGGGNWKINVRMVNPLDLKQADKINLSLRIDKDGQLNMTAGEIVDIVSNATRRGVVSNAKNALEVVDTAATIGTVIVATEVLSAAKTVGKVYDYIFK